LYLDTVRMHVVNVVEVALLYGLAILFQVVAQPALVYTQRVDSEWRQSKRETKTGLKTNGTLGHEHGKWINK